MSDNTIGQDWLEALLKTRPPIELQPTQFRLVGHDQGPLFESIHRIQGPAATFSIRAGIADSTAEATNDLLKILAKIKVGFKLLAPEDEPSEDALEPLDPTYKRGISYQEEAQGNAIQFELSHVDEPEKAAPGWIAVVDPLTVPIRGNATPHLYSSRSRNALGNRVPAWGRIFSVGGSAALIASNAANSVAATGNYSAWRKRETLRVDGLGGAAVTDQYQFNGYFTRVP